MYVLKSLKRVWIKTNFENETSRRSAPIWTRFNWCKWRLLRLTVGRKQELLEKTELFASVASIKHLCCAAPSSSHPQHGVSPPPAIRLLASTLHPTHAVMCTLYCRPTILRITGRPQQRQVLLRSRLLIETDNLVLTTQDSDSPFVSDFIFERALVFI